MIEISCFPTKITHFQGNFLGSHLDERHPLPWRQLHSTFLRWQVIGRASRIGSCHQRKLQLDRYQSWYKSFTSCSDLEVKNQQEKLTQIDLGMINLGHCSSTIATPLKVVSVCSSHQMPDFSAWPPEGRFCQLVESGPICTARWDWEACAASHFPKAVAFGRWKNEFGWMRNVMNSICPFQRFRSKWVEYIIYKSLHLIWCKSFLLRLI